MTVVKGGSSNLINTRTEVGPIENSEGAHWKSSQAYAYTGSYTRLAKAEPKRGRETRAQNL